MIVAIGIHRESSHTQTRHMSGVYTLELEFIFARYPFVTQIISLPQRYKLLVRLKQYTRSQYSLKGIF